MNRTYLYVAFEEFDELRSLGASWDTEAKCWYIGPEANRSHFGRWLPPGAEEGYDDYSIVSADAYVASARTNCWRCHTLTEVACIYCASGEVAGVRYEQFSVSNISAVHPELERQLAPWPNFRFCEYAAGTFTRLNHCSHCGVRQEDYDLHGEPGGVFFSLRGAEPGTIDLTPLTGLVRMSGDEGLEP